MSASEVTYWTGSCPCIPFDVYQFPSEHPCPQWDYSCQLLAAAHRFCPESIFSTSPSVFPAPLRFLAWRFPSGPTLPFRCSPWEGPPAERCLRCSWLSQAPPSWPFLCHLHGVVALRGKDSRSRLSLLVCILFSSRFPFVCVLFVRSCSDAA